MPTDVRAMRGLPMRAGVLLGVCGAVLGGCASNDTLESLRQSNRQLQESQQALSSENDQLRAELGERRSRTSGIEGTVSDLQAENDRLLARLEESDAQLDRLDRIINEMPIVTLNAQTDEAMRGLAGRNDAIEYDAALGLLRFSSDLTFASGSADVTPGARDALVDLADTLADLDEPFELTIIGHTDSVRPAANTARRFPTNRHLSVARAIAVSQVLQGAGVPGDSILTGGWGEFRPIVPNNPSGGTAANRRVEIALSPSSGRQSSAIVGGASGNDSATDAAQGSSLPPITK